MKFIITCLTIVISIFLCILIINYNSFETQLTFNDICMIDELYSEMAYSHMIKKYGEYDIQLSSGVVNVGYYLENGLILSLGYSMDELETGLCLAAITDRKGYSEVITLYKISRANIKKCLIVFIILLTCVLIKLINNRLSVGHFRG